MPKKKRIDGNCIDCYYSMELTFDNRFFGCDYLGKTGRLRPCEYGWACTVKKPVERLKVRYRRCSGIDWSDGDGQEKEERKERSTDIP